MSKTSLEFIAKILLCPETGKPLEIREGHLYSTLTETQFPNFTNIPWVYRNPRHHILQWRQKIKSVIDYYNSQSSRAEQELRKVDILSSTKKRLSRLHSSYATSAQNIEELAQPLLTDSPHNSPLAKLEISEDEKIFFEKIPRQQTVMAYHQTIFRDWAWGEREIQQQVDILRPLLGQPENLLILGGGACGLPLHLQKTLSNTQTLVVDINPILMFAAQVLMQNRDLSWIEYPSPPLNLDNVVVEHKLRGISKPPGLHLLFADAQEIHFQPESFDALLTPWFIDIVSRDFRELSRHLNSTLRIGSKWIHIGPLGFDRHALNEMYSQEEISEALGEAGFEVETMNLVRLPYMQSPHSMVGRQDHILVFVAKKMRPSKMPSRYEYLPDWLRDWSQSIPITPEIHNLHSKTEVMAMTTRLVDGKKSLNDLVQIFVSQFHMSENMAREALYSFFVNVYEQLIFRDF